MFVRVMKRQCVKRTGSPDTTHVDVAEIEEGLPIDLRLGVSPSSPVDPLSLRNAQGFVYALRRLIRNLGAIRIRPIIPGARVR